MRMKSTGSGTHLEVHLSRMVSGEMNSIMQRCEGVGTLQPQFG